jgi:hypothetical protein
MIDNKMDNKQEIQIILDEIKELKRRILLLEMLVSKMQNTDNNNQTMGRFSIRNIDDE